MRDYTEEEIVAALEVLERLELQSARVQKESLLEQNIDSEVLQQVFRMALGPYRYSVAPSHNILATSRLGILDSWGRFIELVQKLRNHELLGQVAQQQATSLLGQCRPLLAKWFCRILHHDLRVGVAKITVDRVWGEGFLDQYAIGPDAYRFNGCCQPSWYYDVYHSGEPPFPLGLERYFSDERVLLICYPEDGVRCYTQSGHRRDRIVAVDAFSEQVLRFCGELNHGFGNRPLYLDGYFRQHKKDSSAAGLVRTIKDFDPCRFLERVNTILVDWAPLDRYHSGEFTLPWIRRKSALLRAAGSDQPTAKMVRYSENISVLGHELVYGPGPLAKKATKYDDQVVLRETSAPHVFTKTTTVTNYKETA